jgi:cyclic pyranopterin phosphate synthase
MGLTHLDRSGKATMVDVSTKPATEREAVARGSISMKPATIRLIQDRAIPKGDVMAAARIAGIMATKKTANLIPLCHPLAITSVTVDISVDEKKRRMDIVAKVKTVGQTGVEMEALTAVSVAALTIYDMCKAVDREMSISDIVLMEKRGGRSGEFRRSAASPVSRKPATKNLKKK